MSRWFLFSPACFACTLLLVANDFLLKPAFGRGAFGVVTGKLSDVTGAIVLTALLELVLGVTLLRNRRFAALGAALLTAVGLTLLETSPAFVRFYMATHTALFRAAGVPWTSQLTMDLTDLLALPAVLLGYVWCRRYAVSLPARSP